MVLLELSIFATIVGCRGMNLLVLYERVYNPDLSKSVREHVKYLVSLYNETFACGKEIHLIDVMSFDEYSRDERYKALVALSGTNKIEERAKYAKELANSLKSHVVIAMMTHEDSYDGKKYNLIHPNSSVYLINLNYSKYVKKSLIINIDESVSDLLERVTKECELKQGEETEIDHAIHLQRLPEYNGMHAEHDSNWDDDEYGTMALRDEIIRYPKSADGFSAAFQGTERGVSPNERRKKISKFNSNALKNNDRGKTRSSKVTITSKNTLEEMFTIPENSETRKRQGSMNGIHKKIVKNTNERPKGRRVADADNLSKWRTHRVPWRKVS